MTNTYEPTFLLYFSLNWEIKIYFYRVQQLKRPINEMHTN